MFIQLDVTIDGHQFTRKYELDDVLEIDWNDVMEQLQDNLPTD